MRRKSIHPKKSEIIAAIRANEKLELICVKYRCSAGTISNYRKEMGLLPVHPNKDKIIAAIKAKEKWDWIMAEYKCGLGTISRYRKEMGLQPNNTPQTERNQKIKELRKDKTLKELSQMFGVCIDRISHIARN